MSPDPPSHVDPLGPDPLTVVLVDLVPMLERIRRLDPDGVVRLLIDADRVTALAGLPVGVLAGRVLRVPGGAEIPADVTVGVAALSDVLTNLDVAAGGPVPLPPRRDVDWHHTLPPRTGWQRVTELDDDTVRGAVRAAAMAVTSAPLPAAAEMALDLPAFPNAIVPAVAALDRRAPSALVKLGFCPRGGVVAVDVCGRWTRLVAAYGSVYVGVSGRGAGGTTNLFSLLG